MNLILDIGNTRTKMAIFENHVLIHQQAVERLDESALDHYLSSHGPVENAIISSVAESEGSLNDYLQHKAIRTILLNDSTPLPFSNDYETKETLGKDRLAGIAGACRLYPAKNVLVIDAGTAITYDIKNTLEKYLGGSISPGLLMRFKALHTFTARLPLLEPGKTFRFPGRTTSDAIISGIQQGMMNEINGFIDLVMEEYPEVVVLLTGGDSHFFDYKLKKTIFVVPDLILIGLDSIINYNVKAG